MGLPGNIIHPWLRQGRLLKIAGHEIFVREEGEGPTLTLLHGFPTSSLDFHRVWPQLTRHHRVIVHDHLGFGLSSKPSTYSYSLVEQADMALMVWRKLGVESTHLVAHDYGTSVATELVARHVRGLLPVGLDSLTLSNGSVRLDLAHLTPLQKILRSPLAGPWLAAIAPWQVFRRALRNTFAQPDRADEDDLRTHWQLLQDHGGLKCLPAISYYLRERELFRSRWLDSLPLFDRPAHLVWGRQDPIAVEAIAEVIRAQVPGASLTWLEGVGHYPMLEAPEEWAQAVLTGLPPVQTPAR